MRENIGVCANNRCQFKYKWLRLFSFVYFFCFHITFVYKRCSMGDTILS